jgi:hypothetical protein
VKIHRKRANELPVAGGGTFADVLENCCVVIFSSS